MVATEPTAEQVEASDLASLSVLGDDDAGESLLTYTWAITDKPTGADDPTLAYVGDENGTNDAKDALATFTSLGEYTFEVTITALSEKTSVTGIH